MARQFTQHLGHHGIAAVVDDHVVQIVVGEPARVRMIGRRIDEVVDFASDLDQPAARNVADGEGGGFRLDQQAQPQALRIFSDVHAAHDLVVAVALSDESFTLKPLQGLAQRRPRYSKGIGELCLDDNMAAFSLRWRIMWDSRKFQSDNDCNFNQELKSDINIFSLVARRARL